MASKNGYIPYVAGIIGIITFLITLYTVFHVPLVNAISQEASARQAEDKKLQEQLNSCVKEQLLTNQQILVCLAELKQQVKLGNDRNP